MKMLGVELVSWCEKVWWEVGLVIGDQVFVGEGGGLCDGLVVDVKRSR